MLLEYQTLKIFEQVDNPSISINLKLFLLKFYGSRKSTSSLKSERGI